MLLKIISGGQTGADIAAIDAAIEVDFDWGGFVPIMRNNELGKIPATYDNFILSHAKSYDVRTFQNVIGSDGTVVFSHGKVTGGSLLTVNICRRQKKPVFLADFSRGPVSDQIIEILSFIQSNAIKVLNVAGPRASKDPLIYDKVRRTIKGVITQNV